MKLKTIRVELEKRLSIDLQAKTRKRPYVYARAVYFRLCRDLTHNTLSDIAKSVGMDHASVIHSFKVFDDVIRMVEPELFEIYSEVFDALKSKPLLYDSPTRYWMGKNYDLQMKFNSVVESYDKLYTKAAFLTAQLKRMGYKNPILDEPIRKYQAEETRWPEEQRSYQGGIQRPRQAYQGQGEGPESNDPVCVKENVRQRGEDVD